MVSIDPDSLITTGNTGLTLRNMFSNHLFWSCADVLLLMADDNTCRELTGLLLVFCSLPCKAMTLLVFSHLNGLLGRYKWRTPCFIKTHYESQTWESVSSLATMSVSPGDNTYRM